MQTSSMPWGGIVYIMNTTPDEIRVMIWPCADLRARRIVILVIIWPCCIVILMIIWLCCVVVMVMIWSCADLRARRARGGDHHHR